MGRETGYCGCLDVLDPDDDSEVYVFVLLSEGPAASPTPRHEEVSDEHREWVEERSGDNVAAILGWMYSGEMDEEFASYMNHRMGKFTWLPIRDMYELLVRNGFVTGSG